MMGHDPNLLATLQHVTLYRQMEIQQLHALIQQLQHQLRHQTVLVLLPNSVDLTNTTLDLAAIEAEVQLALQRPARFAAGELTVKVAQSAVLTCRQLPAPRRAWPQQEASVKTDAMRQGLILPDSSPSGNAQTIPADLMDASLSPISATVAAPAVDAVNAHDEDDSHQGDRVVSAHSYQPSDQEESSSLHQDTCSPASYDQEERLPMLTNHHDSCTSDDDQATYDSRASDKYDPDPLIGTAWGVQPAEWFDPKSHTQPVILPYVPPTTLTQRSTPPIHPFPLSIVTPDRPEGQGPTRFHVTMRGLRPSVSANQLLALAADLASLELLFYPPHAVRQYVGRAAIYFFADRKDAWSLGETLRARCKKGELQHEFGLQPEHVHEAKRRGVPEEGPDGIGYADKQIQLSVTNADLSNSPLQEAQPPPVTPGLRKRSAASPPPRKHTDQQPIYTASPCALKAACTRTRTWANDEELVNESDRDDDIVAEPDMSEWPEPVIAHYVRMLSGTEADDVGLASKCPASRPLSFVSTAHPSSLGRGCHSVRLDNLDPATTPKDLLDLARYCESLQRVYFPPLLDGAPRDMVGRAAVFSLKSKDEARAFCEHLNMRVRENQCDRFKVKPQGVAAAKRQGSVVGRGKRGRFATWQVCLRARMGDDVDYVQDECRNTWQEVGSSCNKNKSGGGV